MSYQSPPSGPPRGGRLFASILGTVLAVTPNCLLAEEPAVAGPATDEPQSQDSKQFRPSRKRSESLLEVLSSEHGYALKPGQLVRRVPTPFPRERMEYYRAGHSSQADAMSGGPTKMVFHWKDDRLRSATMTFAGPIEKGEQLSGIINSLAQIMSHEIEGDKSLLRSKVAGDWVVRPGADKDLLLAELQQILRHECQLPVTFSYGENPREVFVVTGNYRHRPIDGLTGEEVAILADRTSNSDMVHIFGKEFVLGSGAGGGTGDFGEFLQWLGRWINVPLVNQVDAGPDGNISWRLHRKSPFTAQHVNEATEANFVLPNITKQTGLTFTKAVRPAKTLFVIIDTAMEQAAAKKRAARRQEIMQRLAKEHGYALAAGELLKYIAEPPEQERQALYQFMQQGLWHAGPSAPDEEPRFEPFVLVFRTDAEGRGQLSNLHNQIVTLESVLEIVLNLRPQQVEGNSPVLSTYMPGDWILSWNPQKFHVPSEAEVAALEKILNGELNLGVQLKWHEVERSTIVVTGKYKFSPRLNPDGTSDVITGPVVEQADGYFLIPVRRSDITASVGEYRDFLQAVGEVLMTPVVDEATVRPAKPNMFWKYEGTPITHRQPLNAATEKQVLELLSQQTGLKFSRKTRPVKMLLIEASD